jgi:aldehyde dehydrogenase
MSHQDPMVAAIVQEVLERLQPHLASSGYAPAVPLALGGRDGVFASVDQAVKAATEAQGRLAAINLDEREAIVDIIRGICLERAEELGRRELAETKIGRLDHKIEKLKIIRRVLGTEALRTDARTDRSGVCLIEYAPFGVIGMVLPATHSVPTMAANAINIIAAGNTAVFAPHPAACQVAAYALQIFNREIEKQTGLRNLICTTESSTIQTAQDLFNHPDISLICVTGGPGVVKAAMQAGKRVIAAGPGNPPVVVDETADLDQAAKSIIIGGAFDNNLLCIAEKEVFVVASVADAFIAAMRRAGAVQLDSRQIEKLTQAVFTFEPGAGAGCGQAHVKRDFVGKDPQVLGEAIGLRIPPGVELLFGETPENHPFVQEEQMMPFIPIVRVPHVDAAIQAALKAEHGYRHTAIIHSQNMGNVTKMARTLNTTLFVQNAPCTASLGSGGPGYLSYSIATPTGEGVTTPLTFTRQRQLTIGGALHIV